MKKEVDMAQQSLKDLASYLEQGPLLAPEVSERGVDWHIEHSLKAAIAMLQAIVDSDPAQFKPKFSPSKSLILATGKIPRGKAKAPKMINNREAIDLSQLPSLLEKSEALLQLVQKQAEKAYFDHPFFGHLRRNQGIKFVAIHTNHHLKIIRDIVAAQ
ncbi:DUF1569 domain-containing protein [Saprospira grandis]|uniref:DinB-like domain-containing protein n=1 Tax=Saprospira grandis (strain Lewin) TaxID=984262 RepID=H6L1H8_SAPGL|nr:DUF1569 domain-containing protein [Saprospira grandis]AFC24622.1 hypothetical protein SGRA_1888 [Saprospira grandis str. Lewin]